MLTCPDISQCSLYRACLSSYCLQTDPIRCIYSVLHSFAMCRLRRFLAVLRSFFHSSLLYTFLHQLVFHPPSVHLTIYFLVFLSASLFPNAHIILFFLIILFSSILCTRPNQRNPFHLIVSVIVGF